MIYNKFIPVANATESQAVMPQPVAYVPQQAVMPTQTHQVYQAQPAVDTSVPFAQLSDEQKQARISYYKQRDAQLGLSEGLFIVNRLLRIKARYKKDANGNFLVDNTNRYVIDHYEAQLSMINLGGNRQLCTGYVYLTPEKAVGKYGRFLAETFSGEHARRASVRYKVYNSTQWLSVYSISMREGKSPKAVTKITDQQFAQLFDMTGDLEKVKVPVR